MLTILFITLLIVVMVKLIVLSIKAAWGLTKIICTVIFFPLILVGMLLLGLVKIAIPILIIVGILSFLAKV